MMIYFDTYIYQRLKSGEGIVPEMVILKLIPILLLLVVCLSGCTPDDDTLTPDQVDISMIDQVVKVKGKITFFVENPMGVGGVYMKLGNNKGEVDVRIQPETWDNYKADEKDIYKEGKTITVEGILVKAGIELAVIHGKYTSANVSTTSNSSIR
jgi:DNA/RNA endonuclease YhcR with UshA esterase domain